jgi:cyclopropane-fatty-acyl-phospholipid synthase
MWTWLLERMLSGLVRQGTLILHMPDGKTLRLGDGGPPKVEVSLTDPALPRRLVLNPHRARR